MTLHISEFAPELAALLPATHDLLRQGHLVLHPRVVRAVLEGSRGLDNKAPRPDSDIDLSLLVDVPPAPEPTEALAALLRDVLETTLSNWHGSVELDLAAVYPRIAGGMRCFEVARYDPLICPNADGFGLYKTQRGFNGFVPADILDVRMMYPCLTIWRSQQRRFGVSGQVNRSS